jgi:hypothetical protein
VAARRDIDAWIADLMTWLVSPSIIPWLGAVAAIIAALTVETKSWLKSPLRLIGRALRVAVVFLIVAWLLSSVASHFFGRGGAGDGSGTKNMTGEKFAPPPVTFVPGQLPSGTPDDVDLVICFVPSAGDQSVAQNFSCDLFHKGADNAVRKIEIRGRDMDEFVKLLVQQFRAVKEPEAPKRLTILIKRVPYPGGNVMRRVSDKAQTVLPNTTVMFDE